MNTAIPYGVSRSFAGSYRELTLEEVMFVSGGDDPGDSSSDGPGDGDAPPGSDASLPAVTVSAPAESDPGGIGPTQAQQLMQNIDLAMQSPAMALALMAALLAQAASNPPTPGLPALGNPMGDPSPGSPGDGP